jgi:hypothetical protein
LKVLFEKGRLFNARRKSGEGMLLALLAVGGRFQKGPWEERTPWEFTSDGNSTRLKQEALKCMGVDTDDFLPTDTPEAQEHYAALMKIFDRFTKIKRMPYRSCSGPFLENEFIRRYISKPLSFFSPFIPIFMPWFALFRRDVVGNYESIIKEVLNALDSKRLYITFSESDFGFTGMISNPKSGPKNVFILSTSGMGHIAVPWLQCHYSPEKKRTIEHFITFCGNVRSCWARKVVIEAAKRAFGTLWTEYRGDKWIEVSQRSYFGFSPRGIAIGTYRTFELIRMETIPVILSDSRHWLPYWPALNWTSFAIITNLRELPRTSIRLQSMKREEIEEMWKNLHKASAEFFSWSGFFEHFEAFLRGGRSYFTCSRAYLTGDGQESHEDDRRAHIGRDERPMIRKV